MLEPTAAHILANKEQSTEQQVNTDQLILDSANTHHTRGPLMAMETVRYMEAHQINVVHQLVMRDFTSAPLNKINQKLVLLITVAYRSLSINHIQQLGDNLDRETHHEQHRSLKMREVDVELIMPSHITVLGQIFSIMANYRAGRDARWISNQLDGLVPITAEGMTHLFKTIHEKEVKDWYDEMDPKELLQLCYHTTSRLDWFVSDMTNTSLKYDTQVAITADFPQDIDLVAFHRGIQRFSKDIKKSATGGSN
jgi:hypothetical protein